MELSEILSLFDQELRREMEYPDMQKEVTSCVVRFIRPLPGRSIILHSNLDESNAEAVITEQIEYFTSQGLNWDWKTYAHDTPSDLPERLMARGLEPDDVDAVMVLDITEAPPNLLMPPSIPLRQVKDSAGLQDVIQVMEQVWGGNFSWMTGRLGTHLQIPGYLSVYVADVDGQPACAGWTYFPRHSQFASLWGGSTIPEMRKRGLYQAVLAARVQEARQRGRRFMVVDASPMSKPIVARHGFRLLTTTQSFGWPQEAKS
jgi:hypothetical protein